MAASSRTLLERLKRLHPQLIDLSLRRVQRLFVALDHPEKRLPPVIHVAGTNGKGSLIALSSSDLGGPREARAGLHLAAPR